jgi:DNA polymerase III subunit epsilon
MLLDTLTVLDFETTGLSPQGGDRITEVGLVRIEGGRITARYESLVNAGVRIPSFITAYTGITQAMVDAAPPAWQVVEEMLSFVDGAPILAHNASFDHRFFVRECNRVGARAPLGRFLCSLRLSRRVYPHFESHSLGEIARHLGVRFSGNAHRAASDAEVTAEVILQMGRELKTRHGSLAIDTALLRNLMAMPIAKASARLRAMCH